MDNDRLSASVTTDPAETSELLSLSLQYKFGPKELSQVVYGGYYDSEPSAGDINSGQAAKYDINNQLNLPTAISALESMGYSGEGYFGGYQGSYSLENLFLEDLAVTYGVSYLDSYSKNKITSKTQVTLYMPKLGLRGSFQNPGFSGLGNTFWSLSGTYDVSEKKLNDQLEDRGEAARRNFYYVDLHLTSYQPLDLVIIDGGALFRLAGRYTSDVLPEAVKFRTGGGFSSTGVRGYTENEDSGDRGVVFNFEYRIKQLEASLPVIPVKYQPFSSMMLAMFTQNHIPQIPPPVETFKVLDSAFLGILETKLISLLIQVSQLLMVYSPRDGDLAFTAI